MSRRISDKTKKARGYGRGTGADYKPFYTASEVSSLGTTSVILDWKTGRGVHCLSQGEALWYYILRWDDNNAEIYEQYPLIEGDYDNSVTVRLAEEFGMRHPGGLEHIMTTDFYVIEADGKRHAYAVKPSLDIRDSEMRSLFIEGHYWMEKGVPFTLLLKDRADTVLADNIRIITEFYDASRVFDRYSAIKHKLAIKEWETDLSAGPLDAAALDRICGQNMHLLKGEAV